MGIFNGISLSILLAKRKAPAVRIIRNPYNHLYSFLPENLWTGASLYRSIGPVTLWQLSTVPNLLSSPSTTHTRNVDCKSFEKIRRRLVHKFVLLFVYSVLHPLQLY
jgi:hypothetical protein